MTNSSNVITRALGLENTAAEMPIPGERRKEYRRSVDLTGICEIDEPSKQVDCRVLDLTNTGAQLRFSSTEGVPDVFRLHIPGVNAILDCRVAWRQEAKLGVTYVVCSAKR